jgi:hypothetical protein
VEALKKEKDGPSKDMLKSIWLSYTMSRTCGPRDIISLVIPKLGITVCKGCALNKHAKTAFPSSEHRSRGILDLIHVEVCGLMTLASLTSNIYYVFFTDDSSRKVWIYFVKTKDEV